MPWIGMTSLAGAGVVSRGSVEEVTRTMIRWLEWLHKAGTLRPVPFGPADGRRGPDDRCVAPAERPAVLSGHRPPCPSLGARSQTAGRPPGARRRAAGLHGDRRSAGLR